MMKELPLLDKTKYRWLAIIALGMIIKLLLLDYQYIDYGFYLSRWIEEIKANGFLNALKEPFYNYTPSYMYILVLVAKLDLYPLYAIKLVSIAFDYILAFFVGRLAYLYWKKEVVMWVSFALVPIIPTVLLNSAFMSQCDSLYVSFIVASVYFALINKQWHSVFLLGIAFALKAQTAMILPFYFVYMLRGNIKWYCFLVVPFVYFISIVPVWVVGRELTSLLTIYVGQAEYNTELVKNFPNMYVWVSVLGENAKIIGLALVILLTMLAGYFLRDKKYEFTIELWVKLILLSAIVCPFFLPGMLERYMYLGDVMALIYLFINRKNVVASLGIIFISLYSYVRTIYIFSFSGEALYPSKPFSIFEGIPWQVVSILYIGIIVYVFYDFVKTLKKAKGKEFLRSI